MVVKDIHECSYADILDTFFAYAPEVSRIMQQEENNGGGTIHKDRLIDACIDNLKVWDLDAVKVCINNLKQFGAIIDIAGYLKSRGYGSFWEA